MTREFETGRWYKLVEVGPPCIGVEQAKVLFTQEGSRVWSAGLYCALSNEWAEYNCGTDRYETMPTGAETDWWMLPGEPITHE